MDHKQIISSGAAAWGKLSDKEKEPYNKKYNAEKEKYNILLQSMVGGLYILLQS